MYHPSHNIFILSYEAVSHTAYNFLNLKILYKRISFTSSCFLTTSQKFVPFHVFQLISLPLALFYMDIIVRKHHNQTQFFTMHMTSWIDTNDFINGPSMIDSLSILFFYKFYRPVLIHLLSCFRIPNVLKNIVHWAILHFNNNRRLIDVFLFPFT